MVVSEEVTPRGRGGGESREERGRVWGRRALQRDTGREAQTFTEWVREMGMAGEKGASDRGKRRPKRKWKEHLEKVPGPEQEGSRCPKLGRVGLWFMGNGEPHLEDLKGPASSEQ